MKVSPHLNNLNDYENIQAEAVLLPQHSRSGVQLSNSLKLARELKWEMKLV